MAPSLFFQSRLFWGTGMSVLDTSKNARKFDAARMVQNAIADGGPGAFR